MLGFHVLDFLPRPVNDGRLVRLELPCRHTVRKQLVNLFQRSALELRDEEEEEDEADEVGPGPDVAILGTLFFFT